MNMVEPNFDRSTFSKNRERLLQHQVGQQFFDVVVRQADQRHLLSDEHFTVDGTLIEAAASLKRFRRKDGPPRSTPPDDPGNPTVNFHHERRMQRTRAPLIPRQCWPRGAKAKRLARLTPATR